MSAYRISTAARLLAVSDDTVRRWVQQGRLTVQESATGPQLIDGASLAALCQEIAAEQSIDGMDTGAGRRSARNHLTGIVTAIRSDPVMSQVDVQCGPFRVVSLISTEAVAELGLEVGSLATAVVKATNVSIERAER